LVPNLVALDFGPKQIITYGGGTPIDVGFYSVPCYVDWDADSDCDLLVGSNSGLVRLYTNDGTRADPAFVDSGYIQDGTGLLDVGSSGCLGSFPRAINWDDDPIQDLMVATGAGNVYIYLNQGTNETPSFDGSSLVVTAGTRPCFDLVDIDDDDDPDLVVGEYSGQLRQYTNTGTAGSPVIGGYSLIQDGVVDLDVVTGRSSPAFGDLDGDGVPDLICGNTEGNLVYYENVGTAVAAAFNGWEYVTSELVNIDLGGTSDVRSRLNLCDWTGDGVLDMVVGAQDGQVHLYQGHAVPAPSSSVLLLLGAAMLLLFRGRRAGLKMCGA
jgi:hypothetical protein